MRTGKRIGTFLSAALAAMLLLSVGGCQKEYDDVLPGLSENGAKAELSEGTWKVPFSIGTEEMEGVVVTRSQFDGVSGFDNRMNSIILVAYDAASGSRSDYYYQTGLSGSGSLSGLTLGLIEGNYNVYALVNMAGVITQNDIPTTENAMKSLSYRVGGTQAIKDGGIPMVGSSSLTVTDAGGNGSVTVKRLLAKVNVNIVCNWAGARIQGLKVLNANGSLSPFAQSSKAAASSDVISGVFDSFDASNGSSFSGVVYVPENMQGTISGISDSFHKAGDQNAQVNSVADVLTYMETTVAGSGKYSGSVIYRSYLGNNATTNFDIKGNSEYVWNLTYTEEGLQFNDWKHDTGDLTETTYKLVLVPEKTNANVGEYVNVTPVLQTYVNGTLSRSDNLSSGVTLIPNPSANVTLSGLRLTSSVAQEVKLTGTYSIGGETITSESVSIAFGDVVLHELVVTPDTQEGVATVDVLQYTAFYYTITNGVRDAGEDVTAKAQWKKQSGDASVTVASGGKVSASAAGTAVVAAEYASETGTATAKFVDHIEYSLEVSTDPANGHANVGQNVTLYAKYYTITNGVKNAGEDVTAKAQWDKQSGDASVRLNGNVASAESAGAAVVKATYQGVSATANVSFGDVVTYELEVTPKNVTTANVGQTIELIATYYTVTNGVRNGGTNVTTNTGTVWSRASGSTNISVNNSGTTKGRVTATSGGTATIKAVYNGYEDEITVTFNDVVTYELEVTADKTTAYVDDTIQLTATYYTVTNGVRDSGTNVTTSSTWSKYSGSSYITVSNSTGTKGRVTASRAGTATIQATYAGETDYISVTFEDDVTYELEVTADKTTAKVGETIQLTATYYTLTNGVRDSGMNVTTFTGTSWSRARGSSSISVNNSGTTRGRVTASSGGTAVISASYNGYSDEITVTFEDVITYELEVTADKTTADVGQTIQLTAKYYTVTNGVRNSGTTVTTSSAWSRASGSTSISVSNSGSTKGSVTATAAGTARIQATYAGVTGYIDVTFVKPDVITYELVLSPTPTTIGMGSEVTFTATLVQYTNGVQTSSDVVTTYCSWWSEDADILLSRGRGVFRGAFLGNAKAYASYDVRDYGTVTGEADVTVVLDFGGKGE